MTVDCSSCNYSVEVEKKRDKTIRVALEINSVAFDVTGASVWFSVKENLDDLDADALITKENAAAGGDDTQANITDGTGGIIEIYIKPADTVDMEAGDYWYDVVIETTVPRKLQAVSPSRFSVLQPVTLT